MLCICLSPEQVTSKMNNKEFILSEISLSAQIDSYKL